MEDIELKYHQEIIKDTRSGGPVFSTFTMSLSSPTSHALNQAFYHYHDDQINVLEECVSGNSYIVG